MKVMTKKVTRIFLFLLLPFLSSLALAHNGYHRGGWHGHHGGYYGDWRGHGARWVGGTWYGPREHFGGCRYVPVYRNLCRPVCFWDYRYKAERCKTRCFSRPVWVRRCW